MRSIGIPAFHMKRLKSKNRNCYAREPGSGEDRSEQADTPANKYTDKGYDDGNDIYPVHVTPDLERLIPIARQI